jgi:DNA-binding winged helix-turn-helix (wHTH) protein
MCSGGGIMNMFRRDVLATVRFGRFQLDMHRREMFADEVPVPIGGRAFDVLIALIEARGQLVTKDELLSRVWPATVVEENTLQFQISMLRKALGPDRDFIKTICGRGYRFIAEISTLPDPGAASLAQRPDSPPSAIPPGPTSDLTDPEAILAELADLVVTNRLTALACGGVDKTRLGRALGRRLLSEFADGGWISALGQSPAPEPAFPTVATVLDLAEAGPATHEGLASTVLPKCLLFLLSIGAQVRP